MTFECAEWSPKIVTGLPSIDDQHRHLFELAATFCGDGDQVRVLKSLAMLTEYVKVHFREEEELMAACHYPHLDAHRELHGEFRRLLYELLENAKHMTLDEIADEVKYLINGWFYNHILVADFHYVPVVKTCKNVPAPTVAPAPVLNASSDDSSPERNDA